MSTTTPESITCPVCDGHGEQPVKGTYGPTISPEYLELLPCWFCQGTGEVTQRNIDLYEEHLAQVVEDWDL